MLFTSETAPFGQFCFATRRRTQYRAAVLTRYSGLCMREDCGNGVASRAFNIHEVAVWVLH